ncbi:MAG TPA: Rieske (2Fe-2S) protein [Terriglobales bacterium]|nr:Rieske (2Fe-2S) protein [Terriglobales bacterium]
MKSKFNQERRDLLKSTCVMAGAAAVVSVTGSLPAFAADQKDVPMVGDVFVFTEGPKKGNVVMVADIPVDEFHVVMAQAATPDGKPREGDNCTAVLFRVSPDKVPADLKSESAEGIIAYSAVCTHQGCMMNEIHKSSTAVAAYGIICPCHDAIFDPLQSGKNTGGATSRTLPHFPIKSDGGKIVVSDVPSGYVGVKRGF